jgi:hypothetical protein
VERSCPGRQSSVSRADFLNSDLDSVVVRGLRSGLGAAVFEQGRALLRCKRLKFPKHEGPLVQLNIELVPRLQLGLLPQLFWYGYFAVIRQYRIHMNMVRAPFD